MNIYLAGPMSGKPDFNYPEFDRVASVLRGRGHAVLSPHETAGGDTSKPYEWYLRAGLKLLLDCDTVVLLSGWEQSRGATIEESIAHALKMEIYLLGERDALVRTKRGSFSG